MKKTITLEVESSRGIERIALRNCRTPEEQVRYWYEIGSLYEDPAYQEAIIRLSIDSDRFVVKISGDLELIKRFIQGMSESRGVSEPEQGDRP